MSFKPQTTFKTAMDLFLSNDEMNPTGSGVLQFPFHDLLKKRQAVHPRKQKGKCNPHDQCQGDANPEEIIERIFPGVHDE